MTWELLVPIPPQGRHAPPVQALRVGHGRAHSRVGATRLAVNASASADGSARHGDEPADGFAAFTVPRERSTRHVSAPLEAEAWAARRSRLRGRRTAAAQLLDRSGLP